MRYDWPFKKRIVNLPINLKGKSKRISGNSLGGPEQGYRRSFSDFANQGEIMTVMQAKYGLLSITRNNSPFDFPYQSSDVEQVKKMEAQKSLAPFPAPPPKPGKSALGTRLC